MKKLLLTLEYPPQVGGVAVYLRHLVEQFEPDDIMVLASRAKNSFMFDQNQEYEIIRQDLLHPVLWPRWIRAYQLAKELIKEKNIDHLIISHLLPMGYVAMLLKIPYTVVVHGTDLLMARSNDWKMYWMHKILNKAEYVTANSQYTKNLVMEEGVSDEKIHIAYPCPQTLEPARDVIKQKLVDRYNLREKKIILSVNRLVARKGNDRVIEAIHLLRNDIEGLRYIIIGDGPYKGPLEKLISRFDLSDTVTIISRADSEELAAWYDMCDVHIVPSRIEGADVEGFGIVHLEAALFKKPSIAGRDGGAPEAVIDGVTGLIVDPNNPHDIAFKLVELLMNPRLAQEMGERGYERVVNEFQWNKQFVETTKLLL